MNIKRWVVATVVTFVFISVYEMVFHAGILGPTYKATAQLWRPEAELSSGRYMGWLYAGHLLLAAPLCYLIGRTGRSVVDGACLGLIVGVMMSSTTLIMYAVQPLPANLAGAWIAGGLVEAAIAGTIAAAILRPGATAV